MFDTHGGDFDGRDAAEIGVRGPVVAA